MSEIIESVDENIQVIKHRLINGGFTISSVTGHSNGNVIIFDVKIKGKFSFVDSVKIDALLRNWCYNLKFVE